MKRLAIITTHPIQYNAPLFELLSRRKNIQLKVFYTWGESVLQKKFDPGFNKIVSWDIPLLEGYDFEFLENTAKDKGSHHFKGIDNPGILEKIKGFRPDAILVYGWSFMSHLKVLRHFKGRLPVLFRGDSTLLSDKGFLAAIKRNLFLRWVYKHVDFALYVGKNNYEYYKKAGLKDNQLIYAPHVVDNERFACKDNGCKERALQLRNQLGIKPGELIFLYAGKFEWVKQPAIIPEAFSLAEFPEDVHLVMVGNGPLGKEIKEKFKNRVNIHFFDFQNQSTMPSVYEMADVFVLSSVSETWGLAVNEAMANGMAAIVSDKCGCAADLVEEGVNGYIFKVGDVNGLHSAMTKLLVNRQAIPQMKINSQRKIREYDLDTVATSIEQLLSKIG